MAVGLALLFRTTSLGLQMRAAAFAPEVARLLGVRVGRMFTLGWALAAVAGALAGVLVAPSVFLGPNNFDPILISGFVAAVLGGLDSPPGAVLGGLILGLALSYVSGYEGSALVPLAALVILVVVLMVRPAGLFSATRGAAGVSGMDRAVGAVRRSTLLRSLVLGAAGRGRAGAPQRGRQRLQRPAAGDRRLLLRRPGRADRCSPGRAGRSRSATAR